MFYNIDSKELLLCPECRRNKILDTGRLMPVTKLEVVVRKVNGIEEAFSGIIIYWQCSICSYKVGS